ncbi:MAG: stage V sporulation protein B [Peptococcaceae bacterium]|nr:stage V sporulation protein B [Peptococcaceae bacterium]
MVKQSLFAGTAVLAGASFINRILGFLNQVLLIRLISAEGIGLFSMVYPIYVLLLVIASIGIPVATSKLVAEEMAKSNIRGAYQVFKVSFSIILVNSSVLTTLLVLVLPWLRTSVFPNPNVYYSFVALIPGIIIVSLCSSFRGFFQGLQHMSPTAISQTIEQVARVVAGLSLAYLLLPRGIAFATAGASAGVVIGEFIGFLTMVGIFIRQRPAVSKGSNFILPASSIGLCKRIFKLSLPVTLTRVVSTALLSVDAVLIPQRLAVAGQSLQEATVTYGKLTGMAQTMLFTPGMITIALATALIPAISDAQAQCNPRLLLGRVSTAIRVSVFIGLPSAVVFLLLPSQICGLLFGYEDAGSILAVLAVGGPFLYLSQTLTGVLQGLGRVMDPFKNLLIASVFKIAGIYYFTAIPSIAIKGAALALVVHMVIMSLLNLRDVFRYTGFKYDIKNTVVKPLFSSLLMGFAIWVTAPPQPLPGATLFSLLVGSLVYAVTLILSKPFDQQEWNRFKLLLKHAINKFT